MKNVHNGHVQVNLPRYDRLPKGSLTNGSSAHVYKSRSRKRICPEEKTNLGCIQEIVLVTKNRDLGNSVVAWISAIRRIVKTGDQAACLCQLLYWYGVGKDGKTRLRVTRDRKRWIAKSYADFGVEVGLTERQTRGAIDGLLQRGLIEKRPLKFGGKKICHFRVIGHRVAALLAQRNRT